MAFETESIPPIPFLAELREEVLKHSLKRMPKWKFRFAPDIVVQLQPKPTVLLSVAATARGFKPKYQHFLGVAVMMEGVTSKAIAEYRLSLHALLRPFAMATSPLRCHRRCSRITA